MRGLHVPSARAMRFYAILLALLSCALISFCTPSRGDSLQIRDGRGRIIQGHVAVGNGVGVSNVIPGAQCGGHYERTHAEVALSE